MNSYTNSSISCFRRCPREFDLRYRHRLQHVDDDRETLQVGQTWHKAQDVAAKFRSSASLDPLIAAVRTIEERAPGELWVEKLRRLFVGHCWMWSGHPLKLVETEVVFSVERGGTVFQGQIDAIADIDGQLGIIERKTSGEDIGVGAPYWDRLRMDSQLSFYALAFEKITGKRPAFILYDVVRKPTIRPKSILKKDAARLRMQADKHGAGDYYGEQFERDEIEAALYHGKETARMYGARLNADIGDRPDYYFRREVIGRTELDLRSAEEDVNGTVATIEFLESMDCAFPRNPASCTTFGLCDFFGLCSNNEYPMARPGEPGELGDPVQAPDGFVVREHLHPELHQ